MNGLKKMNLRPALLALAVLLNGNVYAGDVEVYVNGNRLLSWCESKDNLELNKCVGYLEGIADATNYNRTAIPLASSPEYPDHNDVCVPMDVIAGQLHKVWVKWANENPQDLNWASPGLVLNAFAVAWPCKPGVAI